MRISVRYFVLCIAIALCGGVEAGAQEEAALDLNDLGFEASDFEKSLDQRIRTGIGEARRQLATALAESDSDTRFNALREAMALRESWIADIVLPLCASPNITARSLALEAVAASNPETGREEFLTALEDPQRGIRLRGLLGLEELGDARTVFDVVKILEKDKDPDLRVVAARTLGAIGHISASSALRRAITNPHAPQREQAVLALLAIGKEDVGRYLLRFLDNAGPPGTVEALKLMALVPDPTLIPLIEPFLDSDDHVVRTQASVTVLSILERSGSRTP
jgi:HEAT repeat protein